MVNYGFQNELDFIELFNGKYLNELGSREQEFLLDVFDGHIDSEEKIKAWKNRINQKTDFFIKYKTIIKSIGLKCGRDNSMHQELIQDFRFFLEQLRVPYKIIDLYANYHYGYGRDENGMKDYTFRLSSEQYKKLYQSEIDEFNKYINRSKFVIDFVDRFIIKGRNSEFGIDVLVEGKVDDYVWIKQLDIYDMFMSKRNDIYTSPHIANIFLGPKKRNLNDDSVNIKDRYQVCARWNSIREDILEYKKLR